MPAMCTWRKTSKHDPPSAPHSSLQKRVGTISGSTRRTLREKGWVHKQHSRVAWRDALMTGILNNDNDAVNESPSCLLNCPRSPPYRRAQPGEPTLDGAGRANHMLFSRRNFTNLIDRGKRTRKIIDFLLRRTLATSSLVAFFVSCRMRRQWCFRTGRDRSRANVTRKPILWSSWFMLLSEMRGMTCKLRALLYLTK